MANRSYSCADRAGVVPVPCLGEKVKAIIRWTGTVGKKMRTYYGMLNRVASGDRIAWMGCRACCMKGLGLQGKNGTRCWG